MTALDESLCRTSSSTTWDLGIRQTVDVAQAIQEPLAAEAHRLIQTGSEAVVSFEWNRWTTGNKRLRTHGLDNGRIRLDHGLETRNWGDLYNRDNSRGRSQAHGSRVYGMITVMTTAAATQWCCLDRKDHCGDQ